MKDIKKKTKIESDIYRIYIDTCLLSLLFTDKNNYSESEKTLKPDLDFIISQVYLYNKDIYLSTIVISEILIHIKNISNQITGDKVFEKFLTEIQNGIFIIEPYNTDHSINFSNIKSINDNLDSKPFGSRQFKKLDEIIVSACLPDTQTRAKTILLSADKKMKLLSTSDILVFNTEEFIKEYFQEEYELFDKKIMPIKILHK